MKRMLALSIRQPYAEQILSGTKKIEYRNKPTKIRGRVYIYAAKKLVRADSLESMKAEPSGFRTGFIVGSVEISNCTQSGATYEWHLARPRRLAKPLKPKNHPQPSWFYPFSG